MTDERNALAKAAALIEAQALEIKANAAAMADALLVQEALQREIADLETKVETLEGLLHTTDEGLSEALIVVGAMRDGLRRVAEAAEKTVAGLAEEAAAEGVAERLKAMTETVSETRDDELFDAHERYLRDLRARLGK
jgi:hypothetical protein